MAELSDCVGSVYSGLPIVLPLAFPGGFWPTALFVLYFTVACRVAYVEIALLFDTSRQDTGDDIDSYFLDFGRVTAKFSLFQRGRIVLAAVLERLSQATIWPLAAPYRASQAIGPSNEFGLIGSISMAKLLPNDLASPILSLAATIAVMLIRMLFFPMPTIFDFTLLVIAVGIVLREIAGLVDYLSLPRKLRLSRFNPYIAFSAIAVCDCITLIIIYRLVFPSVDPPLSALLTSLKFAGSVMSVRKAYDFITGGATSSTLAFFAFAWAVYKLSLLRIALRFREFSRDDTDYCAVATSLARTGKYDDAERWLSKMEIVSVRTELTRIPIYVHRGQFDEALSCARRILEGRRLPNDDAPCLGLALGRAMFFPIDPDTVIRFYCYGYDLGISDCAMCKMAGWMSVYPNQKGIDLLDNILERVTWSQYPLSVTSLMIACEVPIAVEDMIPTLTIKSSGERIIGSCLIFFGGLRRLANAREGITRFVAQWIETHGDRILVDSSCISDMSCALASWSFLYQVSIYAEILSEEKQELLERAMNSIEESIEVNEMVQLEMDVTRIRMERLRESIIMFRSQNN